MSEVQHFANERRIDVARFGYHLVSREPVVAQRGNAVLTKGTLIAGYLVCGKLERIVVT